MRRRDHIRALLADPENPGHDHAVRVMESYEKEWLAGQPLLHAIMHIIGLFDRPASGDCVGALRAKPAIKGLTDAIVKLDDGEWRRAIERLREVRLLAPPDPDRARRARRPSAGARVVQRAAKQTNEPAWRAAHSRLYDHLRRTTKEGMVPKLSDLAPLYQAIAHGCRAGRHQEALHDIFANRLYRRLLDGRLEAYSLHILGASGSNLAAISWFFVAPYEAPVATLSESRSSLGARRG